ncbi:MAG: VRR-NUC domain-containing protein [Acidobacteriaceae bacterium]|nr:VRR-NUC domain-containing protein [Acidobacteriaceae bacterium]
MTDAELDALGLVSNPKSRKPRAVKARKRPEDELHMAVAKLLTHAIAPPGVASADGVLWFSIEGRGKRSIYEGARNKRRGVISGVPDILILSLKSGATFIELKAENGRLSDSQQELHPQLDCVRAYTFVCKTLDGVAGVLRDCGIPHKARLT